jgi:hypothetical protein
MIAATRGRMAIRTHRVSPHDACPASPLAAAAKSHGETEGARADAADNP